MITGRRFALALSLVWGLVAGPVGAHVMIRGGEGNAPLRDPGWPVGAATLVNHVGRAAWWEGPPLGGGEWHSECRGDAKVISAVLADFAKLDVRNKKVVIHDGVGRSFWLNPNDEPAKRAAANVDWTFQVWQADRWEFQKGLPPRFRATAAGDDEKGPPARLDIYTGGRIKWADAVVPQGLDVADLRLEANGFKAADRVVVKGTITHIDTGRPVAARVRLQRVEPQDRGYKYSDVAETTADGSGRYALKGLPEGWFRLTASAEGLVPRVLGHFRFDDQPRLETKDGTLAGTGAVTGRVVDEAGRGLADVDVSLQDIDASGKGRYDTVDEPKAGTDSNGRFRMENVPIGKVSIWVHKEGYCGPGLATPFDSPVNDVALVMRKAAQVTIRVNFGGKERPEGYIVSLIPEGGEAVGKWSGSGNIDAQGRITFKDVPPGKYDYFGRPNPGGDDDQTKPVTVELKGGKSTELEIIAR